MDNGSEQPSESGRDRTATYVLALAIEAATVLALWLIGVYFS